MQQFTHPVHPKSSYLLSYLLRRQSGKNTKYGQQTNTTDGKKQSKNSTGKMFLFRRKELHHKSLPLSNCLLWSVDHAAILCCWSKSSLTDSSRVAACDVVALLLSSISSGWTCSEIYSSSRLVHFERRNTSVLVANEKISSPICVSTRGSDPVLIVGE